MNKLFILLLLINTCKHPANKTPVKEPSTAGSVSAEKSSATAIKTAETEVKSAEKPLHDINFNWPDRRPIGMIMLASFDGKFKPKNPMNYNFDVTNFKSSLVRFADSCIQIMKRMNSQGMITWDIEGQQYAHPASYIGDPTFLPPQMKPVADLYFKKFREAGFRVGICIRPDSIAYNKDSTWIHHYSVADQYKNLEKKIQYAINRWGCSIFYIDSNIWPGIAKKDVIDGGYPMSWWTFKLLHDKFPKVLLIPEWKEWDYFRCTAPYYTSALGTVLLSEKHKQLMPNSFLVAAVDQNCSEIEASVKQGNVMLFPAWWPDPINERIRKAYNNVKKIND
jgi:hypothetical protein